jgi:hypothetical protein
MMTSRSTTDGQREPRHRRRHWIRVCCWLSVAVVAIVGGPLGLLIRAATGQHRAVMALRQRGAAVAYRNEPPPPGDPPAVVDDDAFLRDFLVDVSVVDLGGTNIGDADLAWLEAFPHLETLVLRETRVTDVGLQCLGWLAELKYLDLHGTQIGDKTLELVAQQSELQDLDLGETQVTNVGLAQLSGLARLRSLDLSGTRVTEIGVGHLDPLAQLQWLGMEGTGVRVAFLDGWIKAHSQTVVSRGAATVEQPPLLAH